MIGVKEAHRFGIGWFLFQGLLFIGAVYSRVTLLQALLDIKRAPACLKGLTWELLQTPLRRHA
jgi:hypothetical protein